MTDYISREAAIAAAFSANAIGNSALRDVYDTVKRIRMIHAEDVVERELYQRALSDVVRLSVERPERKHGKWIPHPNKEYREWDVCTACGTGSKRREYGTNPNRSEYVREFGWQFCPNCGARMVNEDV